MLRFGVVVRLGLSEGRTCLHKFEIAEIGVLVPQSRALHSRRMASLFQMEQLAW